MQKTIRISAFVGAWLLLASAASADKRAFTFVYEPKTVAQGQLELEWYMTAAIMHDRLADDHSWNWAHQIEVEYGITDRFDVAMYQMFSLDAWLGYKLRARYRPFDYGQLPVDIMFYLEFIQRGNADIAFEEKIIVGRNFGRFIVSLDSLVEQGPINGDVGFKWHEGLGLAYEVAPWFVPGVETQLRMAWKPKQVYSSSSTELEFSGVGLYVGPTISLAAKQFFWNVNFSFRAVGEDDMSRYLFRVVWGIFL